MKHQMICQSAKNCPASIYIHAEFTVTFPQSSIINFNWTNVFQEIDAWKQIDDWDGDMPIFSLQSLPGLKKVELRVESLSKRRITQMISLSDNYPSLSELRIACEYVPEDVLRLLQKSHMRPDCELTCEWPSDRLVKCRPGAFPVHGNPNTHPLHTSRGQAGRRGLLEVLMNV